MRHSSKYSCERPTGGEEEQNAAQAFVFTVHVRKPRLWCYGQTPGASFTVLAQLSDSIEIHLPTVCGWRDVLDCALPSIVLHGLTSSTVLVHAMTGEVEYLTCGTSFRTTYEFRYVTPQRRGLPVSGISSSSAPRVLKSFHEKAG